MSRLIDADKLKAHYSWWEGGTLAKTLDEMKRDFDTIIDLQPTVELKPIVIDGEEYLTGADYNAYLKGYKDGRAEPNTAIETVNWYHQNADGEMVLGANSNQQAWFKADDVFKALKAEPVKRTIEKFRDYQIEWLTAHNDIEFCEEEENLIIRFLKDTAECAIKFGMDEVEK